MTSVETAGVNGGVLTGLRCEALTHGSVTSAEAGGEVAGACYFRL